MTVCHSVLLFQHPAAAPGECPGLLQHRPQAVARHYRRIQHYQRGAQHQGQGRRRRLQAVRHLLQSEYKKAYVMMSTMSAKKTLINPVCWSIQLLRCLIGYVCVRSLHKSITALVVVNLSNTTCQRPSEVVIGGLACVVFEKFPTIHEVTL